jgi:hypothetical protein
MEEKHVAYRPGATAGVQAQALERILELDRYRAAVTLELAITGARALPALEPFLAHVERCFDWGVTAAACARTWVARPSHPLASRALVALERSGQD